MEKAHQILWDSLREWQETLTNLEKAPVGTYGDVPDEFAIVWCVKGLIIAWKVRPRMGITF